MPSFALRGRTPAARSDRGDIVTIDVPERGAHTAEEQPPPKSVGRRTVLAGAAWSVPAVALAAAAPAHAASGLVLAFDKTVYPTAACDKMSGVKVALRNNAVPSIGAQVTIGLPKGFTFTSGGSSITGYTNQAGVFDVPTFNVGNDAGTFTISAIHDQTVHAESTISVVPNTTATSAFVSNGGNGVPALTVWPNVPAGAKPIGADYFLTPQGALWFQNDPVLNGYDSNRPVEGVVAAVGWYNSGNDKWHADYLLPGGEKWRAEGRWVQDKYPQIPTATPLGNQYFLTESGDLYYLQYLVTTNVQSAVAWSDSDPCADIELKTGVLIRARWQNIQETFSPMPKSAVPIGADYFLSSDGDLFFQNQFVATGVQSAVGWFARDYWESCADYMTARGEALTAQKTNARRMVWSQVPKDAKPLGSFYWLTASGDVYFYDRAPRLTGVAAATSYSLGGDWYIDARMKSGATIRVNQDYVDGMDVYSPKPATALPIGACYFYDAPSGELYYQDKVVATGVTSAFGYHWVNGGDFAQYMTSDGGAWRAFGFQPREINYQNGATDSDRIPANAVSLGFHYFLANGTLYYYRNVVAKGVKVATASADSWDCRADFQLESGASARAVQQYIEATYSPMPADVTAVGADYFLDSHGELYWQGRLVATNVKSAAGYFFYGWSRQVCNYVTKDGVAYRADNEQPTGATYKIDQGFKETLSRGYFLDVNKNLYWNSDPVKFSDGTAVKYAHLSTWSDKAYTHADLVTPDGKYYRLIEGRVQYQYWQNVVAPAGAVPVGIYYFLTSNKDLYYCGTDNVQVLVATGVVEAIGWFDATRDVACVDFRDADGVVVRVDNGNGRTTYPNVPEGAKLLGAGYFEDTDMSIHFGGTEIVQNPASFDVWSDGNYHLSYRASDNRVYRTQGAAKDKEWRAGETPLNATLIGARFALDPDMTLWFNGTKAVEKVSDALGWWGFGVLYADYVKDNKVARWRSGEQPFLYKEFSASAPLPSLDLVGFGYYLVDGDLWFEKTDVKAAPVIAKGWGNGETHFCDYRTADLGGYRAANETAVQLTFGTGKTPLGSDPVGADFFYDSKSKVLSYQGKLFKDPVTFTAAIGWADRGLDKRWADVRLYNSGNVFAAARVEWSDAGELVLDMSIYASVPSSAKACGSGYWLNGSTLYFGNARVAERVASVSAWTEYYRTVGAGSGRFSTSQVATYRLDSGTSLRSRGHAPSDLLLLGQTWLDVKTPLYSKPIGAEYFLAPDGHDAYDLYFRGTFAVAAVKAAVGWRWAYQSNENQYADYVLTDGTAFRRLGVNWLETFGTAPSDSVPVGAGFFLSDDGQLYFEYDSRSVAQGVTAAVGWTSADKRGQYARNTGCK